MFSQGYLLLPEHPAFPRYRSRLSANTLKEMQLIAASFSWNISDWLLRDSKQCQQSPFQVIQLHQHWDICQHRYFLATEK